MMIIAEDYNFLSQFLLEKIGMELGTDKAYLVRSRLEPLLGKFGVPSFSGLIQQLQFQKNPLLTEAVIDAMTTKESLFFRDGYVYEQLRDMVIPARIEKKKNNRNLRFWSAGCSTGQEPYSISMTLSLSSQRLMGWDTQILATDIAVSAIQRSKEGLYSQLEVQRGLSEELIKKFFIQQGSFWKVHPDVSKNIIFKTLNLAESFNEQGSFDVIFCRNVMIYFDRVTKEQVLEKFWSLLEPGGFLLLGSAENILGYSKNFQLASGAKTSIYQKGG